jgi:hypothetical protein
MSGAQPSPELRSRKRSKNNPSPDAPSASRSALRRRPSPPKHSPSSRTRLSTSSRQVSFVDELPPNPSTPSAQLQPAAPAEPPVVPPEVAMPPAPAPPAPIPAAEEYPDDLGLAGDDFLAFCTPAYLQAQHAPAPSTPAAVPVALPPPPPAAPDLVGHCEANFWGLPDQVREIYKQRKITKFYVSCSLCLFVC